MNLKYAIATLAACTMLSGTALADGPNNKSKKQNRGQSTSTSVTGGVAAAGRDGAVAGGVSGAQARQERRARRGATVPNSASTNTSGAVYTTRDSGAASINTGGAAAGSGSVRSSSEGEVYSSTNRQGSEADAYGVSEAEADEPNPN